MVKESQKPRPESNAESAKPKSTGSVSQALHDIQHGNNLSRAEKELVDHFRRRVVGLARRRLKSDGARMRAFGESDIAQDALLSFVLAIAAGEYPELKDREEMWSLLAKIARNKVKDRLKYERAQKRVDGKVLGESALPKDSDGKPIGMDEAAIAPAPDGGYDESNLETCSAALLEVCEELLPNLSAEERQLITWKAEYGTAETAKRLGCSQRNVQLRLKALQDKIRKMLD